MPSATWIKNELEQRGVAFEELHHPEAYTAQTVAQREHISGHRVAKVVVVMAEGRPVELILPASRRIALGRIREVLGTRDVRLATEAEIAQHFSDCEVGALPALRHWKGVEVLMDSTLQGQGEIVFQAGTHCDAVRMHFNDWFALVQPRVETFSEPDFGQPPPA
jgi:Ala-tRNA(Pro) deacylase